MNRFTPKRALAIVLALVMAALVGPTAAGQADPDTDDDHTIAPAEVMAAALDDEQAQAAATGKTLEEMAAVADTEANRRPACTLSSNGPETEFTSCLRVEASLDRAPRVGETATLTVRVDSTTDFDDADLVIDVPDGLVVREGPGTNRARERAPRGDGEIRRRASRTQLAEGDSKTFKYRVEATEAGEAPIEIRISGELDAAYTDGAMTIVPLTVGDDDAPGQLAVDTSPEGGVADVTGDDLASADSADLAEAPESEQAPLDGDEPATQVEASDDASSEALLATSCISGRWGYAHPTSGYTGVPNYQVQVINNANGSALATGVTNGTGNYNLCYASAGAGLNIFVRYTSANSVWRVRNTAASNSNYTNSTGVVFVANGANHSFGNLQPSNNIHRGIHAFHAIDKYWKWGKDPAGNCFDWGEATCRQMTINWTATSTDGTYYSTGANDIHLAAADPDSEHTVIHEGTHAVMDDVYNDNYPAIPNCNPHTIQGASSQGCAWTEGFAEWVPAAVLNDPFYRWASGASLNLETPTWGTAGWGTGDAVEGRVAGAMIDISDASNDGWDTYSEPQIFQYQTFQRWGSLGNGARPATYPEYWSDRGQDGKNVSDDGANAANYQNTIDYSYRNNLYPYAQETWGSPQVSGPHRYRISNTAALNGLYWSVVAVRPASADYDLRYYEDFSQTSLLASSAYGGNTIDLIAADHNHRPTNLDYPRVDHWSGSGNYTIEWAAAKQTIGNGLTNVTFGSTDVVHVRDSSHTTGTTVYYRAVPAAGQDVELLLMDSNPATASTFVQGRSSAVRTGSAGGAGAEEAFNYSTTTDWLGLVLLNKSGSGTVKVYRDTTAPTGTVAINGGAADTASTAVTLNLSAADSQTGIRDLQISTDGVFDTEPWQSYTVTKPATLPAGDGTKRVWVRYRNNANMVTTVSDTIRLYTGPRCLGLIPTHVGTAGNDVINGTAGADIIVGLAGNDTINGLGGNDIICAGDGNDVVRGGDGNDNISGGAGNDDLRGGNGNDTIRGEAGNDSLRGEAGNDTLSGGAGDDTLLGGDGNDTLLGGDGADLLRGEGGVDNLDGGAGPDRLHGGPGSPDVCTGGAGVDVNLGGCEQVFTIP